MLKTPDFHTDILEAFQPIMLNYHYIIAESGDFCVRLESRSARIRISYDILRGGEVSFGFSIKPNNEEYNLGEIYRELEVPGAGYCSSYFDSDYKGVISFVRATCDILLIYCKPVLLGDREIFKSIELRSTRESQIYTRKGQFTVIYSKAREAWKNKQYLEYINMLEEYREYLSESDSMKFEYASKKIAGVGKAD